MKKLIICCVAIVSTLFIGVFIAACNTNPTAHHSHAYNTSFSLNEAQHWHECSCGKIVELSTHTYQEIQDNKFLKTQPTQDQCAVYYKSCICGKATTETFNGNKLPSTLANKTFAIDFASNTVDPISCKYETPLESVESSLNKNLVNTSIEKLYTKLNNITGVFAKNNSGLWKISSWAKDIIFTDNVWTYNQDITTFEQISSPKLYSPLNNSSTFMAYADTSYLFSYNPTTVSEQYLLVAVSNQNKVLPCDVQIFDSDFNNIPSSINANYSTHIFSTDDICYIQVRFATTQKTTLVATNYSTISQAVGFDNCRLSSTISMLNGYIYSYRINVSSAGSKLQIMQTAGDILVMNSSGIVFNIKSGTNIYELPTDYYTILVKCTNGDNSYRLQYSTGKYVTE